MKILVVGPQFPDSFARNITVNLSAMGHKVTAVDGIHRIHHRSRATTFLWTYLPRALPLVEKEQFRQTIRTARKQRPELIIITFAVMPPEIVQELRNACGATVVCWYADSLANLDRQYLLAAPYDAVFTKEPFLVRILREKLGTQSYYLPECCNPLAHKRVPLTDEDRKKFGSDLVAMGTLHYYRARMLELFEGYDLKVWGRNCPPWLLSPTKKYYTGCYVTDTEKAKALGAAKIVLTLIHCTEVEGVNGALFQTAGCGAFQIVDWKPALAELFEPEREIVTFRTREELKEKVDYYLAHPEERQEIADRAYARAHRDHTYQNRLRKMLQIIGLPAEAIRPAETLETMSTV
jgi:spore maturation protein CgeB